MQWEPDVSAGDWLRERIDDPWRGTMHDVVPRGFAAYARVLHPASVTRLADGERMPSPQEWANLAWPTVEALTARTVHEPLTWADAASAFGTVLHPTAQWNALIRTDRDAEWQQVLTDDGTWVDPPQEGRLDDDTFAALLPVLAAHTTTDTAGAADAYAAVWEGWGGLVGAATYGSPSARLVGDVDPGRTGMLYSSLADVFNRGFRKPKWQSGLLSDETSRGPRLTLPNRDHVLFRGALSDLAANGVPWRAPDEAGLPVTPSIVWPADRAWALVTEVDFDSTVVGGNADLVAAICAAPGVEALPIPADSGLWWGADTLNR